MPQPRPRFYRGHAVSDTPESRAAKQRLALAWVEDPFDGPVSVEIELDALETQILVTPLPLRPALRGDIDNYAKLVLDALNGAAWRDDRQVVELRIRK